MDVSNLFFSEYLEGFSYGLMKMFNAKFLKTLVKKTMREQNDNLPRQILNRLFSV